MKECLLCGIPVNPEESKERMESLSIRELEQFSQVEGEMYPEVLITEANTNEEGDAVRCKPCFRKVRDRL